MIIVWEHLFLMDRIDMRSISASHSSCPGCDVSGASRIRMDSRACIAKIQHSL